MTRMKCTLLIYAALAAAILLPDLLPAPLQPLGGATAFAQEVEEAAPEKSSKPDPDKNRTLIDMVQVGGLIMFPIGLCSVWMLALLVELILKLRNPVVCPPESTQTLRDHLGNGDFMAAWQHSSENPSMLCTVMQRALRKLSRGQDAVETEASEALMDVNNVYRTKISYLSVVAGVAPMLGLLGTVSGMIKAFDKMGHEGAIGDPAKLAGDIGEALVTTFSGLLVAIPAMIVFYVMTNRLKKILTYVQEQFTGLMEDLNYNKVPADLVLGGSTVTTAGISAGSAVPHAKPKASSSETVPCPSCSRDVKVGSSACASCGQELDWS